MIIEVNGTHYDNWDKAAANIRLDTLANSFSFNATSSAGKPLPFKLGDACSVLVDGEQVLNGYIEIITVDIDSESHDISIDGRDKTGDILDSTIGSLSDIRAPISLKSIIELVLKHLNSPLTVSEEFTPDIFEQAEDLIAPEPGQEVWELLQSYARKKQVLLTSDSDGNIVITRSSGVEVDATLHHRIKNDANNVLSSYVSYDATGRFNKYLIMTQLNTVTLVAAASSDNEAITNQQSTQTEKIIRAGRQLALLAENSGSNPKERAEWEANIRRARGSVYSCKVDGFRNQTGELWKPNTLVRVDDEQADIQSRMLINSVQFSKSLGQGRVTTLSLVNSNSYTLELEEPEEVDNVGGDFNK